MATRQSGHSSGRHLGFAAGGLAFSCVAFATATAFAADPPQPDFSWPYGRVQMEGANLDPAEQQVIALVNGKACGESTTFVAEAGEGVPAADVGKTVYVVNVLADGPDAGQRSGCGVAGALITLYFPVSHRIALQQPQFVVGGQRADVELGPELAFRMPLPMLAGDGLE